jgi:hypothetical protein
MVTEGSVWVGSGSWLVWVRSTQVSLGAQTEGLVILELVQCGDECVCNRVTDVFGCLRLSGHPLTECVLCDVVTDTLAKCVEFANLTLGQSGMVDGHRGSFFG